MIEKNVSDVILQKPIDVTVGGKTYTIQPPTLATMILASEEIAKLPEVNLDEENIVYDTMREAKNSKAIGKVLATFILGAKRARRKEITVEKGHLWIIPFIKVKMVTALDKLSDKILEDMTPKDGLTLISEALKNTQITDFFALTTFLNGVNVTKRKVEN